MSCDHHEVCPSSRSTFADWSLWTETSFQSTSQCCTSQLRVPPPVTIYRCRETQGRRSNPMRLFPDHPRTTPKSSCPVLAATSEQLLCPSRQVGPISLFPFRLCSPMHPLVGSVPQVIWFGPRVRVWISWLSGLMATYSDFWIGTMNGGGFPSSFERTEIQRVQVEVLRCRVVIGFGTPPRSRSFVW